MLSWFAVLPGGSSQLATNGAPPPPLMPKLVAKPGGVTPVSASVEKTAVGVDGLFAVTVQAPVRPGLNGTWPEKSFGKTEFGSGGVIATVTPFCVAVAVVPAAGARAMPKASNRPTPPWRG